LVETDIRPSMAIVRRIVDADERLSAEAMAELFAESGWLPVLPSGESVPRRWQSGGVIAFLLGRGRCASRLP
jgi:hypothetical protein